MDDKCLQEECLSYVTKPGTLLPCGVLVPGDPSVAADSVSSPQGTNEPASVTFSSCTAASALARRCETSSPATPCSCSGWTRGRSPIRGRDAGGLGQQAGGGGDIWGLSIASLSPLPPPGGSSSSV